MKQRILQFIDFKGINKNVFYKKTGLSNGFLDKTGSIGVDKLEKILNSFPEINVEWLITGNGQMIKKAIYLQRKDFDNELNEPIETMGRVYFLLKDIEHLKEKIKEVERERDFYQSLIKPPPIEKSDSA